MPFCTACGTQNEDSAKFCKACGKSIGGESSQTNAAPIPKSVTVGQVMKCPSCGGVVESFQTRCSTCGQELNTAKGEEIVKSFFQKLEEINNKEYEANKQREAQEGKRKRKRSKAIIICETIAITSLILIITHVTGMNTVIVQLVGMFLGFEVQ